ncbi:heteromeric transposase endonuclease subunit TnsA [Brevibacillus fluminis]|uniref:Heteromeric transposase endonuclease subunit TnsA n=1 Tax=Brevibacillus fluminis TaxID=511487 RepID=A0A3M8CVN4_9BACL|nr:TnsA endonuclease N-terminal domain-containing protein [Brevibacillus fluminis]RNB79753.1 heteromeric transposase endonuclease subunit TnsA [Brevibacillus fluminis]
MKNKIVSNSNQAKDKFGQLTGKNYKPSLTVRSFSSEGNAIRAFGYTSGREHHLLSNLEYYYFLLLDWNESVVDMREQYPLSIEETIRIAESKGIPHPKQKNKNPVVMTSDFNITVIRDGRKQSIVRTVKPSIKLEDKRTIEKFEIERAYWQEHGISWGIVTEKELHLPLIKNIEWVRSATELDVLDTDADNEVDIMLEVLKERLMRHNSSILRITSSLDDDFKVSKGVFLTLFRHLIARRIIKIDMLNEINLNHSYFGNLEFITGTGGSNNASQISS